MLPRPRSRVGAPAAVLDHLSKHGAQLLWTGLWAVQVHFERAAAAAPELAEYDTAELSLEAGQGAAYIGGCWAGGW